MMEYTLVELKPENEKPHIVRMIEYMERNLTRELGPKTRKVLMKDIRMFTTD